ASPCWGREYCRAATVHGPERLWRTPPRGRYRRGTRETRRQGRRQRRSPAARRLFQEGSVIRRQLLVISLVVAALGATTVDAAAGRVATPPLTPAALTNEFPAGWEGFHTYAEMSADIDATVAAAAIAHPNIIRKFSIGKSYQGRDLWAVKISDNVDVDENEPEVLFDGLHHAREHMAVEMTLA